MSANPDRPRIVSPPTSPETHHPKYETLLREFTRLLGAKLLVNGANCECSESNDRLLRYLSKYQLPLFSVPNAEDTKIQDSRQFSFPSLTMFRRHTNHFERNSHDINNETSTTSAESIAVRNLDEAIKYNRCDIVSAPSQLAFNVSSSFASLTAANLRQYLKRHVLHDFDENTRAIKAKQMTASFFKANGDTPPTIGLQSISTSFDVPHLDRYSRQHIQDMEYSYPEEVILPLRFKAEIAVNINQKAIEVSMETTGVITAYFNTHCDDSIKSAEITMDTARLLTSMRNGARMVALKAITKFSDDMAGVYDSDEERIQTLSKHIAKTCTSLTTPEVPSSNAVYVSPQITGKRASDRNNVPPLKKRARLQMRSSNAMSSNTLVRSTLKRASLMTGLDVLRESRNDS